MAEPTRARNGDCHPNCHEDWHRAPLATLDLEDAELAFLALAGLGCVSCANRVRNSLLAVSGVRLAEIDLDHRTASVWYDPRSVTVPRLLDAVARAGDAVHHYTASLIVSTGEAVA